MFRNWGITELLLLVIALQLTALVVVVVEVGFPVRDVLSAQLALAVDAQHAREVQQAAQQQTETDAKTRLQQYLDDTHVRATQHQQPDRPLHLLPEH